MHIDSLDTQQVTIQVKDRCIQNMNLAGFFVLRDPIDQPVSQVEMLSCFLPEDFKVYTNGKTVVNRPFPGFEKKTLPTFNHYMGSDGGYVAIYTHEKNGSVYGVGGGIYVVGQVRVQGEYQGRIFVPKGYNLGDNITRDPEIIEICESYFPQMKGKIWIGGDTGGWMGIRK